MLSSSRERYKLLGHESFLRPGTLPVGMQRCAPFPTALRSATCSSLESSVMSVMHLKARAYLGFVRCMKMNALTHRAVSSDTSCLPSWYIVHDCRLRGGHVLGRRKQVTMFFCKKPKHQKGVSTETGLSNSATFRAFP